MEGSSGNNNSNFKRKKKRSFNQIVKKKFKKNASFAKGHSFDSVEHEYFLRVLQLERSFEGTLEEKKIFVENALAQTENREVECSYNQLISRVIESLLPMASKEVLVRYFDAFAVNFRPIIVHEYASHVLQALMVLAAKQSFECKEGDEHSERCHSWLIKAGKFLLNNIEEFMWDPYASQCLRTAMLCVAGMPQMDKHNKGEAGDQTQFEVSDDCANLLEEFNTRVAAWPNFRELVDDHLSSGYIQTLLIALKPTKPKVFKTLCYKILADCFPSREDKTTLGSPAALFVLEVMIEHGKKKFLKIIYEQLLATRILEIATAKMGNITLRKFLNHCKDPEILVEIVNALLPQFSRIHSSANDGVLVALCQACERTKSAQSEFYQGLLKFLNCEGVEDSRLVAAILSVTPLPHETDLDFTDNKQGSLMLQTLFNFQKPIKLVNSLLSYEPRKLAELLSSQYGSFLSGSFCKSEFIGEKSRVKLINHLMGNYSFLAQSKFGSRTFDDIWEAADVKHKGKIVQDLSSEYSEVMKSRFGQFVASKVFLELFRSQGLEKWKAKVQSIQSKKNLFASIIKDVK